MTAGVVAPESLRHDPYYPITPGTVWIYRDLTRQCFHRTKVCQVEEARSGEHLVTIETASSVGGRCKHETLSVRQDGVYAHAVGRWHGPAPRLPLQAGERWLIDAESSCPLSSRVVGPIRLKLPMGLFPTCMRVDQVDTERRPVRTEWYALRVGLARWVDHWADHDEVFELIYFLNGATGHERGRAPGPAEISPR